MRPTRLTVSGARRVDVEAVIGATWTAAGRITWRQSPLLLAPGRGASDKALALFSSPASPPTNNTAPCSVQARTSSKADRIKDDSGCLLQYERTFMWPPAACGVPELGH